MMRLLKALVIVAILSIASCTRGELSVQVRSDLSSKDFRTIGVLNYEWRGSLSTVEVEITDSEYYSKILKDAGSTYYFEFKCTSRKTPALKSALKIPKKATALGFQVYTNSNDFINSVNIVTDRKLKTAFAKAEQAGVELQFKSSESTPSFSNYESDPDLIDDDFVADPASPDTAASAAEKAREKAKAEKPKPWYKEYFWYLAIGGFFVYRIATMDKTQFTEQLEKAKKTATEMTADKSVGAKNKK